MIEYAYTMIDIHICWIYEQWISNNSYQNSFHIDGKNLMEIQADGIWLAFQKKVSSFKL